MGTLVPPNWSIQRFSAQHVTSGYAVEETAAAVLLVVIPVERRAGGQWNGSVNTNYVTAHLHRVVSCVLRVSYIL